jgi:hypothetical protein
MARRLRLTGFLDLYNPAVAAMGLPALQFTFPVWIMLLALAIAGLLILSYWVRRGTWWTVHAAYLFALLILANGIAHLSFSIHRRAWIVRSLYVAAVGGFVAKPGDYYGPPDFLSSISSGIGKGENDPRNKQAIENDPLVRAVRALPERSQAAPAVAPAAQGTASAPAAAPIQRIGFSNAAIDPHVGSPSAKSKSAPAPVRYRPGAPALPPGGFWVL